MSDTYSVYEAKAHLSAILRKVQHGAVVTVSHRGRAIAEIRPVQPMPDELRARLDHLATTRVLWRSAEPRRAPWKVANRRGALRRFLAERDG